MKIDNFRNDYAALIGMGGVSGTSAGGTGGGSGSTTLDGLTDVTITSASDGDVLTYNGTAWVNEPIDTASGGTLEHGNLGTAVTFDLDAATWHSGTLNAGTAVITVTGFDVDAQGAMTVKLVQDDPGGGRAVSWDADIAWLTADQPSQDEGAVTLFVLATDEGDATIYGVRVGSPDLSAATTVESETSWGITPAVGTDTQYARQDHTHGTPDDPGAPAGAPELTDRVTGSDVDMSGAATGTGVSVTAISGTDGVVNVSNASYQYWDVASAVGTGDFDYRARIISAKALTGISGTPLFRFGVTDGSRTGATALEILVIAKGLNNYASGPSGYVQAVVGGSGGGAVLYNTGVPVVVRIARVSGSVTFYASDDNGATWAAMHSVGSNTLNVGKVGMTAMHPNGSTTAGVWVHYIRSA